jgi:SpoVK/Ycf46/Vps4 family AAA+-type ATPase
LYRLDLTNIHRAYLDHPEQGLKEALATVDRLAPCVLWIDEIETGLAGGGDVRTAARLVGQFSYWLQEAAARVFVVSTANDVARLPAELVRKGHFDEVFFVDLPSEGERREIITLYVAHYLGVPPADELLEDLVSASAGFACSDLAAACAEVAHMALLNGIASVEDQRWKDIFANTTPLSRTNPEQIAQLRSWGRQLAVPASGRPIGGGDPTESHGRIVIA